MCETCDSVFSISEKDFPEEWKMMWDTLEFAKINWKRNNVDMKEWKYCDVRNYNGKLVHFFTHKCHPYTKRSEYYAIDISESLKKIVEEKLNTKIVLEEKKEFELVQ